MQSGQIRSWLGRNRQRATWMSGVVGVSLLTMVSFQNCTQPVPVEEGDEIASMGEKLSFAYTTTVDQIAYMSCSNVDPSTVDASTYFTVRAGAYRNAGLSLRETFFSELAKKTSDVQKDVLSNSAVNSSTMLQLAIRDINNFQTVRAAGGTAKAGYDYTNVLEPLGTYDMSELLVDLPAGSRLKYVRNGTVQGSRLEGSLYFTQNYSTADAIRKLLTNGSYFTLTYTNAGEQGGAGSEILARGEYDVSGAGDSNRSVFGSGFSFTFGQPNASPLYTQFPQAVVKSVTEFNLENIADRSGLGTWTCPATMQFRIVRASDISAPGANCRKMPDPATLTPELAVIRNTLKTEDWWVDMDNRCIIAKKSGPDCYGTATSVKYTMGDSCNTQGNDACVQYASICYRTN